MRFSPVDVMTMVEEARENWASVASSHPVTVSVPTLPKVSADPEMVSKVLTNRHVGIIKMNPDAFTPRKLIVTTTARMKRHSASWCGCRMERR